MHGGSLGFWTRRLSYISMHATCPNQTQQLIVLLPVIHKRSIFQTLSPCLVFASTGKIPAWPRFSLCLYVFRAWQSLVTVQALEGDMATDAAPTVPLPDVMKAAIRPDIVTFVHSNISKNSRQPYAVSKRAGHQISAESEWVRSPLLAGLRQEKKKRI